MLHSWYVKYVCIHEKLSAFQVCGYFDEMDNYIMEWGDSVK